MRSGALGGGPAPGHTDGHLRNALRDFAENALRDFADDHARRPIYGYCMTIRDVIERHGYTAHGGDPDAIAESWEETGIDAAEIDEWLRARRYSPEAAEDMADAGVRPQMAIMKTDAGSGDYVDTVAFKVATGDLEVEEARELVGAS